MKLHSRLAAAIPAAAVGATLVVTAGCGTPKPASFCDLKASAPVFVPDNPNDRVRGDGTMHCQGDYVGLTWVRATVEIGRVCTRYRDWWSNTIHANCKYWDRVAMSHGDNGDGWILEGQPRHGQTLNISAWVDGLSASFDCRDNKRNTQRAFRTTVEGIGLNYPVMPGRNWHVTTRSAGDLMPCGQ